MSAITLADLLDTPAAPCVAAADAWKAMAGELDRAGEDLARGTRFLGEAWPSGAAADVATAKVTALRTEVDAACVPANRIAQALAHHAAAMADLRTQAEAVVGEASARGLVVDRASGVVSAPGSAASAPGSAALPVHGAGSAVAESGPTADQVAGRLTGELTTLLARARGLDDATVAVLNQNLPDPATGFGALPAPPPVSRQEVADQRGRDPKAVNEWWRGLTPAQQAQVINDYPELVGWLDGVPAHDRDTANRIVLSDQRETLLRQQNALDQREAYIRSMVEQGRGGELYPGANPVVAGQAELWEIEDQRKANADKLAGLDTIADRLDATGGQRAYLLGISTEGNGRAIVSVGDPDAADNVATYVPGTYTRLNGELGDDILRSDAMASDARDAAPGERTAVVMWLGYDAPQSIIPEAARNEFADAAAPDLRRFQDGLRVTHDGPAAHQTVLGHSYGTTVVGHAATSGSLNADSVVFVASPGVGVDHAGDLHLTGYDSGAGHVYATTAEHDIIAKAGSVRQLGAELATGVYSRVDDNFTDPRYLIHGQSPIHGDFGATVFASDPGSWNGKEAHGQYWDQGNIARDGMALIIVGDGATLR